MDEQFRKLSSDRAIEEAIIVGDSIWDMMAARRAGATAIGLLSGGTSNAELIGAGAARICDDPADLMLHVDALAKLSPAHP